MENQLLMFEIESSNIKAVGYDGSTRDLRIQFKSAAIYYDYHGVKPELFAKLMKADSKGQFYYHNIKGKFEFSKIPIK